MNAFNGKNTVENSSIDKQYPIIDDIGSFPLPNYVIQSRFKEQYWDTYKAIISNFKREKIMKHRGLKLNVIQPIIDSFKMKVESGLDVPSYPRHWDMHTPFLKPIEEYSSEPYLIDSTKAKIIEVDIIREYARDFFKTTGTKLRTRVCVTGAMELYLKSRGHSVYKDIAINFAKSINKFIKNSLYHDDFFDTPVISIDEPSIGIMTYNNISDDDITDILDIETSNIDADVQIHLHSLSKSEIVLNTKNINILTCEYASNPNHKIPKIELDRVDKYMRVGVTRTNISHLIAKAIESGRDSREFQTEAGLESMIDPKERIQKRYEEAVAHYGDRLKYVGPDCGLIGWTPQNIAFKLLERTVSAIKEIQNNNTRST